MKTLHDSFDARFFQFLSFYSFILKKTLWFFFRFVPEKSLETRKFIDELYIVRFAEADRIIDFFPIWDEIDERIASKSGRR